MFWFWFWSVITVLMAIVDVAWWVVAMRLAKRRLWRVLISIFMAVQLTAHLSDSCGLDWVRHSPKALIVSFIIWHYFALFVLLPIGLVWTCAWMIHRLVRAREVQPTLPVAVPATANAVTRRDFLGACAALGPPLFTIGLTGVAQAQLSHFRVRRFTLAMPSLPRALDGMTIAHVTDMHVGGLTSSRVLREMVNTTNALRADLVLLTGDLIDYRLADLAEGIALVQSLAGRYGLWMVDGNHDLFENGPEFERRVRAAGVPLLLNESAVAKVRGQPVQLLGLRWTEGNDRQRDQANAIQLRELMKQRQPDAFPILLAHHPHAFDAAVNAGLPLTLSGHTHGGYLMLDRGHGVGSVLFRYWSGLYTQGRSQLIVSNGVGNWFPIRVNAPAEIVHLTLRCAAMGVVKGG